MDVRTFGTFPAEWGTPVGTQFSEERARWVRDRVQEHRTLTDLQHRAAARTTIGAQHAQRRRHLLLKRYAPAA